MQAAVGFVFGNAHVRWAWGEKRTELKGTELWKHQGFATAATAKLAEVLPYRASCCTPNQVAAIGDETNDEMNDGRVLRNWKVFDEFQGWKPGGYAGYNPPYAGYY